MAEKDFEFGLTINKARKEGEKMVVTGYASDTLKDNHNERFDAHAMNQMLDTLRTKDVPLMTSHKDSFGFGKTIEGKLYPVEDGGIGLEVDFELNPKYPQSEELFEEVSSGECEKQISVGGKLNKENPRAAYMTRKGEKVLHDFNLDHFCTTRPAKAANARTAFKTAVFKSLENSGMDEDVWKSLEVDDEEAKELGSMGAVTGGNGETVEKFFFMSPPGGPFGGGRPDYSREDELEGENRKKEDLPSFKTMRDNGFGSYYVPLYWEGHKVLEALKDVKNGKSRIVEKIDDYPVDDVSDLMKKTGVKDPKKIAGEGKVGLYAVYMGADNLDSRNVGLDPTMKRAVAYTGPSYGQMINNRGEETYDDIGRLTGGGFLFAKEGRSLPGEKAYTPFWKVPSVMEAQVLIPDAVDRLEARDGDMEKDDDGNWIEKETLELTETRMMPFYRKKIKLRTKSTEGHSHELRLVINNKGEIEDGYTFTGASDFAHGHRKWGEDHVHVIRKPENGKIVLSEALGHTHEFVLPEMPKEVMEMAKTSVVQKTLETDGYFTKGNDGEGLEYDDVPKTSDLSQTGQSSYALLLKTENSNLVRQLGKITRMEAYRLATGATKPGTKVVVGRSVGKADGKLLYRMLSEFSPSDDAELDKVVPFRAYPVSPGAWSFSAGDGNALVDKGWKSFADAHAYYEPAGAGYPDNKGAYKLPHHKLVDGNMRTFERGVIAAMAALNGARGGTAIPAGERQGVYNHLAKHYRQMNREAPPMRGAKEMVAQDKEVDTEYLTWLTEFHKEQGDDVGWINEEFKTEDATMGSEKEEKKVTEETPVEDKPTDDPEVKEAEKTEEKEAGAAEKLGSTILNALGLSKPSNKKVERTSALLGTAGENLKETEITGDDAATLLTDISGVLGQLKSNLENGKLDLESLPEKDAKMLRAFMGGEELPKETVKEEPVVEKESEPFDMEALSDRLAEKTLAKINEKLEKTLPKTEEESADDAPKTEDAPADEEGDAPEDGDAPKTEVPEGEKEEANKDEKPDEEGEKEKSDDSETVEKTDEVSNKQILDALNSINQRVEKVETVAGVSKSLDGQEGTAKVKKKGIFHGVIPSVNKARLDASKK